jgi:hypothetical protein
MSISEQFKVLTENILLVPYSPLVTRSFDYPFWLGYVVIPLWTLACLLTSLIAIGKFNQSQGEINE